MGAAVAMRADIDHKGARLDVDFVGADQEDDVESAGLGHVLGVETALPRNEAEVERADPRRCGVQHRKAGPVAFFGAEFGRQSEDRRAVVARQRALPDQNQRAFGLGEDLAETVTLRDLRQRVGAGAEIVIVIGQIGAFADQRRPGNCRPASGGGCAR